jgi:rubrerythrin
MMSIELKEINNLKKFQCEDCGTVFYVDCDDEEEVCCPVCVVPMVLDWGSNVVKLSEGKGD